MEGLIFGGTYLRRKICVSKSIELALCLVVGRKFIVFALFYSVFEGNFPSASSWGAYTWRGLFSEFYGISESYLSELGVYIHLSQSHLK